MGDTFVRIHNWDSEVVGGVGFEAVSSSMVRDVFGSVEDGIAQALNLVLHVKFCTDAVIHFSSCEHSLKKFEVLFHGILAVNTLNSNVTLLFHLVSRGVISIGFPIPNKPFHVVLKHFEVIGGVSDLIRGDAQGLKVTNDIIDELDLLIHGIGVVKT